MSDVRTYSSSSEHRLSRTRTSMTGTEERRVLADARLAVRRHDEAPDLALAGPPARLPEHALEVASGRAGRIGLELLGVDAAIPNLLVRECERIAHRAAIARHGAEHGVAPRAAAHRSLAGRHHDARGEALDVPLPRRGDRLVEVAHVEDEPPLRRREDAEVAEVRVAAGLHVDLGMRQVREVPRHDHRRAAQERERRSEHAAPAHGRELSQTGNVRLLEHVHGIRPLGERRWPGRMTRAWDGAT